MDAQGVDSSPAIANGVVYIATLGGLIMALNATTGQTLWSYQTNGQAFNSPVVVNGWLYCGSNSGYLYAFSL